MVKNHKRNRTLVFDFEEEAKGSKRYSSQEQDKDNSALRNILNGDKPIKNKVEGTPVPKINMRLQPLNHNLQGNFPSINLDGNGLTQKDIQYPVKNTKKLTRVEESSLTNIPKLYKKNEYLMNLLERDSKPQHSKRSVYGGIRKN